MPLKRKKLFPNVILILSLILLTGLSVLIIYLKYYSWRDIASVEQMRYNGRILQSTPKQPEQFYKVYDILFPGERHIGMLEQNITVILSGFNVGEIRECKCDDIGYMAWNNDNMPRLQFDLSELLSGLGYHHFGFGLESYSSPEACFDFWLNHDIFWQGKYLHNLDSFSVITLHKPVSQLSENEMIRLAVYRNWGHYSVFDPEKLEPTVEAYRKRYLDKTNP